MAHIEIGESIETSRRITVADDAALTDLLSEFATAVDDGRPGILVPTDGGELIWIPSSTVLSFVFDGEVPEVADSTTLN